MKNTKIIDVSWHRNGIGGVGFYAILFTEEGELMVATLFDEIGYCAVYNVNRLAAKDIAFGSNSYRGDVFESKLRPLVEEFLSKKGTNRIGPFSVPAMKQEEVEEIITNAEVKKQTN